MAMQGTTLFPRMAGIVPPGGKGGSCVFCKEAETVTTNGKASYRSSTTSTLNTSTCITSKNKAGWPRSPR